jgi:hypothetical protein
MVLASEAKLSFYPLFACVAVWPVSCVCVVRVCEAVPNTQTPDNSRSEVRPVQFILAKRARRCFT